MSHRWEEAKYALPATRDGAPATHSDDDDDDDPFAAHDTSAATAPTAARVDAAAAALEATRLDPDHHHQHYSSIAHEHDERHDRDSPRELELQAQPGPRDAAFFRPATRALRRTEAAQHGTPGAFSAAAQAVPLGIDPPPPRTSGVDGSVSPRDARRQEKQRFLAQWARAQEAAMGLPAGSACDPALLAPFYAHAVAAAAAAPAPAPRSKVAFRPLPSDQYTGPDFRFFPEDSPPARGALPASVGAAGPGDSVDEILARSVEFIPLSSDAGAHAGGTGVWKRMSTWSKIQFNREGMRLEDDRNARGTAEQVLYMLWRKANNIPPEEAFPAPPGAGSRKAAKAAAATKPSAEMAASGPVYRKRLPSGALLLTSAPPISGVLAPPSVPTKSLPFKVDRAAERTALAAEDWNVLSRTDPAVLDPYDPLQRARREELSQARTRAAQGLWGARGTEAQRIARRNVERERMVYEDCNAAGRLAKSSYRFIPKVNNRKVYHTSWGPATFGAGAANQSMPFLPYPAALPLPLPGISALHGWAGVGADPKEAWKAHTAMLRRERSAMRAEDMDAVTGARHVPPADPRTLASQARTKANMERGAMTRQDRNAVSGGGYVQRQAIGSGAGNMVALASLHGRSYPTMQPYRCTRHFVGYTHVWNAPGGNKHKQKVKRTRAQAFSSQTAAVLGEDQSTNAFEALTPLSAALLAHGQAFSQRLRCKYRYIDWNAYGGGFTGVSALQVAPPGSSPAVIAETLKASAAAAAAAIAPPAAATQLLDKHGRPVKKHRAPRNELFADDGSTGRRRRGAAENDPQHRGQNINTVFTLIPRWNETDAPYNPLGSTVAATAVTAPGAVGPQAVAAKLAAAGPFVFTGDLHFNFDAVTTPFDERADFLRRAARAGVTFPPSRSAEEHARLLQHFPHQPQARLFRKSAMQLRAEARAARDHRHIQALREAALAASGKLVPPRRRLTSEQAASEEAALAAMLSAQRIATAPWDAVVGSTAQGLHSLEAAGGPSGLFGALSHARQQGVGFFNGTASFGGTGSVPAGGAPLLGLTSSPAVAFAAPSFFGASPSATGTFAAGTAASPSPPLSVYPYGVPEDSAHNPFSSPAQLEQLRRMHETLAEQQAARDEQAQREKDERRRKREERKAAEAALSSKKRSSDTFGTSSAGSLTNTFQPISASATTSFAGFGSSASPLSPKSATAGGARAGLRSPVFGSMTNPHSQEKSFARWNAFNAAKASKGASVQPQAQVQKKKLSYSFAPHGRRHDGLDTSDEDDDDEDDEDDPFAAFNGNKRKLDDRTTQRGTSQFEVGIAPFGASAAPVTSFSAPPASSTSRRGLPRSPTRGNGDRAPGSGTAAAGRSRSQSPLASFARPEELQRRRRERERTHHSSTVNTVARHFSRSRERSLSPFSFHERNAELSASSSSPFSAAASSSPTVIQSLYPAHRSSVQYRHFGDSGLPRQHDPLAFAGHSSTATAPHLTGPFQSSAFAAEAASSSSDTLPFYSGVDRRTGTASFQPFNAAFPSVHSDARAYAVSNPLSPSPTKRLKAVPRERGSKRSMLGEDALDGSASFGAQALREERQREREEVEWEAARQREEDAARLRNFNSSSLYRSLPNNTLGHSTALYSTQPLYNAAETQVRQPYPGVNVHIHGGSATATVEGNSGAGARGSGGSGQQQQPRRLRESAAESARSSARSSRSSSSSVTQPFQFGGGLSEPVVFEEQDSEEQQQQEESDTAADTAFEEKYNATRSVASSSAIHTPTFHAEPSLPPSSRASKAPSAARSAPRTPPTPLSNVPQQQQQQQPRDAFDGVAQSSRHSSKPLSRVSSRSSVGAGSFVAPPEAEAKQSSSTPRSGRTTASGSSRVASRPLSRTMSRGSASAVAAAAPAAYEEDEAGSILEQDAAHQRALEQLQRELDAHAAEDAVAAAATDRRSAPVSAAASVRGSQPVSRQASRPDSARSSARGSARDVSGGASPGSARGSVHGAASSSSSKAASVLPSHRSSRRGSGDSTALMRQASLVPLPASSVTSRGNTRPPSPPPQQQQQVEHDDIDSTPPTPPGAGDLNDEAHAAASAAAASVPPPPPPPPMASVFGWKDAELHTDELSPAAKRKPVLSSSSASAFSAKKKRDSSARGATASPTKRL